MSRLPPFFALRALEAAARHRSYSRAAGELSVTHGAVSQQIRKLEAELGARLFERRANSMLPTADAQRLARQVRRSMDLLHRAVAEFAGAGERARRRPRGLAPEHERGGSAEGAAPSPKPAPLGQRRPHEASNG